MKESIEHLLSDTYNEYKLSGLDKKGFYDLTLSIMAWKEFSAFFKSTSGLEGKWHAPPNIFFFDFVMKRFIDPGHKSDVELALIKWEKYNDPLLTGLLSIDSHLIYDIPNNIWQNICRKWVRYFTFLDGEQTAATTSIFLLIDCLELFIAVEHKEAIYLTPKELTSIMVSYLRDKSGISLYDPYSRSGNLLIGAVREIRCIEEIAGYSPNKLSWKIANLRLILEKKIANVQIDEYRINSKIHSSKQKFDLIISNPPYGGFDSEFAEPDTTGDWFDIAKKSNRIDVAFLCHILNHLSDNGHAAILVPAIFLSGNLGIKDLIKRILTQNILDAVIELPHGLFPHTNIASVLLCFNKTRKGENRLFLLDASKEIYKKGKVVYLNEKKVSEQIQQIKKKDYRENENLLVVTLEDIANQNYDLQISSYKPNNSSVKQRTSSKQLLEECEQIENELKEAHKDILKIISLK